MLLHLLQRCILLFLCLLKNNVMGLHHYNRVQLKLTQFLQFVLGSFEFNDEQIENADFNNDDTVNILDVVSIVNLILFGNTSEPMSEFSLEDINPNSDYYGEYIGPSYFSGQVTGYYFGKAG